MTDFIKFDTQRKQINPKLANRVYSSQSAASKERNPKSPANDLILQIAIDEINALHVPQPGTSQGNEEGYTTVTRNKKKKGSSHFHYPTDRILADAEKLLDSEDQMQQ